MRVIEYKAHNVMRLSDIRFDMDGRHLFLVGGANGQGKTSSLNGILMALCGRSGMDYPDPALKEGESSGWVSVKLSGDSELHEDDHLTVQLEFTRRRNGTVKEAVRILDSTGEEAPEPRKTLRRLYETKAFDPLEFDRLKKRERREVLIKLLGLDLEAYQSKHKRIYDDRTVANREADRARSKYDNLPFDPDAPSEPIDVAELVSEIEKATEHNEEIRQISSQMTTAISLREKAEAEVKRLGDLLAEAKKALQAAKKNEKSLANLLDKQAKPIDTDELKQKLSNAEDLNRKFRTNQARAEQMKVVKEAESAAKDLDDQLKQLEEDQDEALKSAKWPVPGMSIDDEGVLLDGLPLESACKSKRIVASTKVGMSLNPKLRLLVCEDGSDLDRDTLQVLDDLLKEHDFQMLVELVTRSAEDEQMCAVIIKDGRTREDERTSALETAEA